MDTYYEPVVETMPREQLRELEDHQIREVVRVAYQGSPFYKEKFDRAGISPGEIHGYSDLYKLPLLTKDEVRREQQNSPPPLGMMTTFDHATDPQWGLIAGSSGTTGAPVMRNWSKEEWRQCVEAAKRTFWMSGIRPGDRGYFMNPYEGHIALGMPVPFALIELEIGFTNAGIFRPMSFEERAVVLKMVQPTVILGGASYLRQLGEWLNNHGVQLPVRKLFVAGEPGPLVSKRFRDRVAEPFGLTGDDVYDMFGSADATINQFECSQHTGIHLWVDKVTYEIVDPISMKPLPPGQRGILVVTTTYQKSHPWIRYFTEDYAIIDDHLCACGRTHPRLLSGILGRLGSEIFVREEMFLPAELEGIIAEVPESTGNYQLLKYDSKMNELKFNIEIYPSIPINFETENKIRRKIESMTNVPVSVQLFHPGKIEAAVWKSKRIIETNDTTNS